MKLFLLVFLFCSISFGDLSRDYISCIENLFINELNKDNFRWLAEDGLYNYEQRNGDPEKLKIVYLPGLTIELKNGNCITGRKKSLEKLISEWVESAEKKYKKTNNINEKESIINAIRS